jgi:hypothetical protein
MLNKPQRINIQSRMVMDPRINFAAFSPPSSPSGHELVCRCPRPETAKDGKFSLSLEAIFLPPRLMDFMTSPIISFPSRWTVSSHDDESRLLMRLTIACGSCHFHFRTNLRTRVTRRRGGNNKTSYHVLIGRIERQTHTLEWLSRARKSLDVAKNFHSVDDCVN